ncbi:MAG: preprotein translocase subunit SecG [Verrucomicrobiales bacterium]|jgi:preprotein translocase subunit SecG|nr:preprotein translocase subunit SecG [Verrucomicrobiales bacterium]
MVTVFIYILTVVFVICSLLLTLVVLMQRPRSEGLGAAFGGGMTDSLFGAQTTDVLTKVTIWLAGIFFACTLGLALLHAKADSATDLSSRLKARAAATQPAKPETPAAAEAPASTSTPAQPAAPAPAAPATK